MTTGGHLGHIPFLPLSMNFELKTRCLCYLLSTSHVLEIKPFNVILSLHTGKDLKYF